MPSAPSQLVYALLSDVGRVRRANQDTAAHAPELGAYVVCDGMGGAAAGEVASRLAAQAFLDSLHSTQPLPEGLTTPTARATARATAPASIRAVTQAVAAAPLSPQARLHDAALAANRAVYQQAVREPMLDGMGTTLVGLLFLPPPARDRRALPRPSRFNTPPDLFLVNVGDSRCYRRRAGSLLQLSTDHSFVEDQVRAGQITPAQAAESPMRNYITRAVGPSSTVDADLEVHRTQPGDLYLLCTDGLTRELDHGTLRKILDHELPDHDRPNHQLPDDELANRDLPDTFPTESDLQRAAHALVSAANQRGGHDNITVLLIACPR